MIDPLINKPLSQSSVDPIESFNRLSRGKDRPASITAPPLEAPQALDAQTKKSIGEKLKDSTGSRILRGLGKEYVKGFELVGTVMHASTEVSLPKNKSVGEIGKFAFRLGLCPFKTGVGLLLSANLLLGMVLATPIIAAAKAFPKQTEYLFRAKQDNEEGIR